MGPTWGPVENDFYVEYLISVCREDWKNYYDLRM